MLKTVAVNIGKGGKAIINDPSLHDVSICCSLVNYWAIDINLDSFYFITWWQIIDMDSTNYNIYFNFPAFKHGVWAFAYALPFEGGVKIYQERVFRIQNPLSLCGGVGA